MTYSSLDDFLKQGQGALARGPVALIFAEDGVELGSTLHHHLQRGFKSVVVFSAAHLTLPDDLPPQVHHVQIDMLQPHPVPATINPIIAAAPGTWFYYGFNAEYLFHPFSDTRSVGELIAFNAEERRNAVMAYVVDLYPGDLEQAPNGVSISDAHLDRTGYYAHQRQDDRGRNLDKQMDFYGGLHWRFQEFIPPERRRIDRPALFKAQTGLELRADHTFNRGNYNTYSCPWHHSTTAAVASFRTAKALRHNPDSARAVRSFYWKNATKFDWTPQQLLDLGLMEPGQWF